MTKSIWPYLVPPFQQNSSKKGSSEVIRADFDQQLCCKEKESLEK